MTNLSQNLVASATRRPDSVALRCDDQTYTYAQFDNAAARVATLLRQAGIEPGDRVGVMLPNGPAFAAAFSCKPGDAMVRTGDQQVVIW